MSSLLLLELAFATDNLAAKDIPMSFGDIPPFAFADGRGLAVDLINHFIQATGSKVQVRVLPNKRTRTYLKNQKVQGIGIVDRQSEVEGLCYTEVYINFENMAITLESQNYPSLARPKDITKLDKPRISSFQDAKLYLGDEYNKAVDSPSVMSYGESSNILGVVKQLFFKRADLIVMESTIFDYYRKQLAERDRHSEVAEIPVTKHSILPTTPFRAGFLDANLCKVFNLGLKKARQDGSYQKIYDHWTKVEKTKKPSRP
ncbi:substrate-binding periplasmic protein [Pseudobacteriovorax antillogorgiicola]|nr:transporter substrate-binding domain-containing protein [Pseudobacteriovorax antillogorgiicola]